MITKNPMQLKAFIKKKAAEKNISAQLVMQNYMLERLLERISLSKYKHNFILKGGFLISAIVGLDTRATMDLDTTIKGFRCSVLELAFTCNNIDFKLLEKHMKPLLLCVGERHIKLRSLKCCVGHIVQLMDRLLGKLAHIRVHVLQGVGDPGKCPAPVGVVVHTDQIFFLYGKHNTAHTHTSKSLFFFFAAAFFGAAAFSCPSLSLLRTDRRGLRRGRLRFSSLLISA